MGALFLAKFYTRSSDQPVYFSNPTWANHNQIFGNVGLPTKTYPYFSTKTKGLDFEGMKSTIQSATEGSIILLHACAHNPTGVDPTREQWKEIATIIREKKDFPFWILYAPADEDIDQFYIYLVFLRSRMLPHLEKARDTAYIDDLRKFVDNARRRKDQFEPLPPPQWLRYQDTVEMYPDIVDD